MIEINLLPEELKTKHTQKISIESSRIIHAVIAFFVLLIGVHIFLLAVGIGKSHKYNVLNKKWQDLQPQKNTVEELKKTYNVLSADANTIRQLASQRINCSEKLNRLSLDVPYGIWFNELSVVKKDFLLRGSAVSLEKIEITLINDFMDKLKNDAAFFKDFISLELTSIQRRTLGGYDIVDFILVGKLN